MPLIDPSRLNALLADAAGRFDVDALAECDSTNSEVMRRADGGAPSGLVVVADRQRAGRGRRGRSWLSSPESALTFSLLWRFGGPMSQLSGLSLAVGLGVAEALTALGARGIGLKWPNDILLQRDDGFAKLGGVLVELVADRRGIQAVLGIGLNLEAPREELAQPAAGLDQALTPLPDRHVLLAAVLAAQARVLDRFAGHGFAALRESWQAVHAWQGEAVQIVDEGSALKTGYCRGVDADGSLLLETESGVARILAGDVSLRRL